MKIQLKKDALLMSETDDAKRFAEEHSWLDRETITTGIILNLRKYHNDDMINAVDLLAMPKLYVAKNHYRLCVWAEDAKVQYNYYNHDEHKTHWCFAVVSFDVTDSLASEASAYIRCYEEKTTGTV